MEIESKLIAIGNSKGVILPSSLLKSLHISISDKISISEKEGAIVIKIINSPRAGWEEQIKREVEKGGPDEQLIPDVFDDENLEQWTW